MTTKLAEADRDYSNAQDAHTLRAIPDAWRGSHHDRGLPRRRRRAARASASRLHALPGCLRLPSRREERCSRSSSPPAAEPRRPRPAPHAERLRVVDLGRRGLRCSSAGKRCPRTSPSTGRSSTAAPPLRPCTARALLLRRCEPSRRARGDLSRPVQITARRSFGRKAYHPIEANATFMGADVAASTRLLEQLCDRLRPCRLHRARGQTSNMGDGVAPRPAAGRDRGGSLRKHPGAPRPRRCSTPGARTALVPRIIQGRERGGIALRAVADQRLRADGLGIRALRASQDKGRRVRSTRSLPGFRTLEDPRTLTSGEQAVSRAPAHAPAVPRRTYGWALVASVALCVQQGPRALGGGRRKAFPSPPALLKVGRRPFHPSPGADPGYPQGDSARP
jgi:hypothetical protein